MFPIKMIKKNKYKILFIVVSTFFVYKILNSKLIENKPVQINEDGFEKGSRKIKEGNYYDDYMPPGFIKDDEVEKNGGKIKDNNEEYGVHYQTKENKINSGKRWQTPDFMNKHKPLTEPQNFQKIVHIDLKGAPPKLSYFIQLIPFLKLLGATGLLVEYEDMFPYWGSLEGIPALNSYTRQDIAAIYKLCQENKLEFIPLVQTFGHMGFVLKLKNYLPLREVHVYPESVCPTHQDTFPLIKTMIDQIVEIHPGIKNIHIGCDEVYSLALCNRCQSFLAEKNIDKSNLFLWHVKRISQYVYEKHHIKAIIWDDHLRHVSLNDLIEHDIGKTTDIMVWKYSPNILNDIGNEVWEKYSEVFKGVWVAGAFKGASSPSSFLTPIDERLDNTKEWMNVINLYRGSIAFKGIVLTGWQRFDHFSVICEVLPVGIPSLAISLSYIDHLKADHSMLMDVGKTLDCDSYLNTDLNYVQFINHCTFPGSKVYEVAQELHMLKLSLDKMLTKSQVVGWITNYNIRNEFSNPNVIEMGVQNLPMLHTQGKLILDKAKTALSEVFAQDTVDEWITVNMEKIIQQLSDLKTGRDTLLSKMDWPRRPLNTPPKV